MPHPGAGRRPILEQHLPAADQFEIADYFQLLTDRYGEHKLIKIALDGAHKSLELCIAEDIKSRPKLTTFAAFPRPVPGCRPANWRSRSTVTSAEGETTIWQPAKGHRLASLGRHTNRTDAAVSACEKLVGCNCMESAATSWQKVACQ